jgi:hypothetical protein
MFVLANAIGGRAGLAVASGYVALIAGYCLLNFWACREAHCALTGPGFAAAGLLGLVAVAWPGAGLSWYRSNVVLVVFLVVMAAGYTFERAIATRSDHPSSC